MRSKLINGSFCNTPPHFWTDCFAQTMSSKPFGHPARLLTKTDWAAQVGCEAL